MYIIASVVGVFVGTGIFIRRKGNRAKRKASAIKSRLSDLVSEINAVNNSDGDDSQGVWTFADAVSGAKSLIRSVLNSGFDGETICIKVKPGEGLESCANRVFNQSNFGDQVDGKIRNWVISVIRTLLVLHNLDFSDSNSFLPADLANSTLEPDELLYVHIVRMIECLIRDG